MRCSHPNPQWTLADCNEDGWKCCDCNTVLGDEGFDPRLDRAQTREKVGVILLWMHELKFMYVSNATEGDGMTAAVAQRCHSEHTFDQQSIVKFLIETDTTHAAYWREQAKQAMCLHPGRTLINPPPSAAPSARPVAACDACGHVVEQRDAGPLFGEPF